MAQYELRLHKSVVRDLGKFPKEDAQRIVNAISGLASNPRPPQSRKLFGVETYRLRCGVYRVLYEIQDDVLIVHIVRVGHRKDVYRN